jgi:hypothetical protein
MDAFLTTGKDRRGLSVISAMQTSDMLRGVRINSERQQVFFSDTLVRCNLSIY